MLDIIITIWSDRVKGGVTTHYIGGIVHAYLIIRVSADRATYKNGLIAENF